MRITNVEVKNYRSLKEVAVDSLKAINMIYGYNNTGKSNFLRFVELLFRRKVGYTYVKYTEGEHEKIVPTEETSDWWKGEFNHSAFMFTDDDRKSLITFVAIMEVEHSELGPLQEELATDCLRKGRDSAHIRFEGTIRSITYNDSEISLTKVMINKKMAYDPSSNGPQVYFPSSKRLLGNAVVLNSLLALFNDCVLFIGNDRYMIEEQEQSNIPGRLSAQSTKNWLFRYSMDSQNYNNYKKFLDFIKAYQCEHKEEDAAKSARLHWPLSTGDIGFGRFGQSIDLMLRNSKGRFPLSSYGTGVQQVLYLLAKLFFTPACIVLVEEIELNLSPTAQRELFLNLKRLLEAKHLNQMLFTTHSNYFNYRGDFQIYEAFLDKNGYTHIKHDRAVRRDFFKMSRIN